VPWIAIASIACGACSALFDVSKLGGGEAERNDGGPDALTDARTEDARDAGTDATTAEEDSAAPCPGEAGAPMKRIGVFCIDSTEVTNAEYAAFLDRTDGGAAAPVHAACGDDRDRVPVANWPAAPAWGRLPVVGVSWCDAWSYCKAAGKRLCGRRGVYGGASLASSETSNAEASEWYRACSKAGTRRFPYGNEAVPGECATDNRLRWVGEKCEGGYAGIFDMVGNAAEWIDSCDSQFNGVELCALQGGDPTRDLADCKTVQVLGRHAKNPITGFRCCAD
jgi:formylglycine-generating enzyme required for sulfatase activity